jgi:hypothetical protein
MIVAEAKVTLKRIRRARTEIMEPRKRFMVQPFESNYNLPKEHCRGYIEELFRNSLPEGSLGLDRDGSLSNFN